jgi:toxin ParE1/3/4
VNRIKIRPTADEDMDREASNIATYAGVEAGLRFYDACEHSFSLLASQPKLGVSRNFGIPVLAEMRMWKPKGFDDYLIFYRPIRGGIEVLKVINGSRDLPILFAELAEALTDDER